MKTEGGLDILGKRDKEAGNNLLDQLGDYGLFIVRNGELESWLTELDASGHGPGWLIEIFEKMGEDPEDLDYLKPGDHDVWEFLSKIKSWCLNTDKKGIPS